MLVSSHLMSEMQQTADRLIVVGRGRLIADTTTEEMLGGLTGRKVRVRSPQADDLFVVLRNHGLAVRRVGGDGEELEVDGTTAQDVGGSRTPRTSRCTESPRSSSPWSTPT